MSISRKQRFINHGLRIGGCLLTITGAVFYGNWLIRIDPFQRFRPNPTAQSNQVAMSLNDVKIWSYDRGKMVGSAQVDKVEIMSDRQNMLLTGVRAGRIKGEEGEFTFNAPSAHYQAYEQRMTVRNGGRLANQDMTLKIVGFVYSHKTQRLETNGKISGLFYGGQIEATDLVYSTQDGSFTTGPLSWSGTAASAVEAVMAQAETQEVSQETKRSKWTLKADGAAKNSMKIKGDIITYTNVQATDGEVIVKAQTVEIDRKTDILIATGAVQYFSSKANLICEKATVYRKEKRAVLTGNVTMLVKPKDQERLEVTELKPFSPVVPESISKGRPAPPTKAAEETSRDRESVRKYPVSVWAEKIVYFYAKGSRRAEISGNPQARQDLPESEWRHVWSPTAFYDGEKETLKLVSSSGKKDTRMKTSLGDDLIADWLLISTKEDAEDEIEGEGVEGDFMVKDEDLPEKRGTKPPTGNSGGGGGGLRGNIGKFPTKPKIQ